MNMAICLLIFFVILNLIISFALCQRRPDRMQLCRLVKEQRIEPLATDSSSTIFVVVGAFNIYRGYKPYFSGKRIIFYEAFKHNIKQHQQQFHQLAALMFEVSCFSKGLTHIIIRLLLGKIYKKRPFVIMAVFTDAYRNDFARAAQLLLPDFIPLFGFGKVEYIRRFELDEDVFPVTQVMKRDPNQFLKIIEKVIKTLNIKEINLVTDTFTNSEEEKMLNTLKPLFKINSVCVLTNLETPKTRHIERALNRTVIYSKLAGTFFVYSNSDNYITRLINIVHELHQNRKFTWIVTEKPDARDLSNFTKSGDIIYFFDYTKRTKTSKTLKFSQDFKKITIRQNPWIKQVYRRFGLNFPMYKVKLINADFHSKGTFYYSIISSLLSSMLQIYQNDVDLENLPPKTRAFNKSTYQKIINLKHNFKGFRSKLDLMKYSDKSMKHKVNRSIRVLSFPNYINISGICETSCGPGKEQILWNNLVNCCWICTKCKLGSIRTVSMNTTYCQKCPPNTMSNMARTECVPYKLLPQEFSNATTTTSLIFVTVGLLICLFLLGNFYRYRHTPIVKSSDVNPLFLHLFCHTVLISIQILPFVTSSKELCYTVPFFVGFFWTFSSVVTFVKAQKFLYIFNSKVRRTQREIKTSKLYMATIMGFCLSVQIAILVLVYIYYDDTYKIKRDDIKIVEYFICSLRPYNLTMFVYIEILLFICMVQSYRARKLPTNFNETKYISISVLCAEVFLLSYMISGGKDIIVDNILMCMANISLVAVMYGYRMMIILYSPHLNNAGSMHKQLFEMAQNSVHKSMSSDT